MSTRRSFRSWHVLLLAMALAGCSFAVQARQGINLADEGFLWYGVLHTASGEVPLRDFQSYDPGRYYWSAAGTFLFGKGLVALRFSETLFQVIGLWAGLLAATRIARSWTLLVAIGFMLTVWMFPSHKLFDHSLLLVGIWMAVRMVEKSSHRRVAIAGAFVGLCVLFGRNHALYNFVAQGALLLFLWVKDRPNVSFSRIVSWGVGVVVGLAPILAMLLCVPGFFAAYRESVAAIFRHGTNLGLPIPWLWQISYSGSPVHITQSLLLGFFLISLPVGYLAAIGACIFMPIQKICEHALFAACAFVGLPYVHHVFSRADLSHLAQGIHPFTLGLLALLAFFAKRGARVLGASTILILAGLASVGPQLPFYLRLTSPVAWTPYDVGGKIFVPPATSQLFDCLKEFETKNVAANESVLIIPFTPGLYPILDRPSPLWDLSFYYPATEQRQKEMIQTLAAKNVNWSIVADVTLDKREDLRFSATHALVWQYLQQNFEPVDGFCLPRSMKILHRRLSPHR